MDRNIHSLIISLLGARFSGCCRPATAGQSTITARLKVTPLQTLIFVSSARALKLLYSYEYLIWLFLIRIATLVWVFRPTYSVTKTVATVTLEFWDSDELHAIEPRVNVINLLRLPANMRLLLTDWELGTHILHMDYEERLSLGAWLAKSSWLLNISCSLRIFYKCSWWYFLCYFDLYVWIVCESPLVFNNWFHQRNWIFIL